MTIPPARQPGGCGTGIAIFVATIIIVIILIFVARWAWTEYYIATHCTEVLGTRVCQ